MKNKLRTNTDKIQDAISQSSKMEGLSFHEAKKDKKLIQTLKEHGRAFAIKSK